MTNVYSVYEQGAYTANTESLAVEIDAPTNVEIRIRKIRITASDGTDTTVPDYYTKLRLVIESAAGSGGTTFTPVPNDANAPAAASTVKTGPFTIGTVSSTIDTLSVHSGTDFNWEAKDEDDKIVIAPGGIFAVTLNPAH